MPSDFRQQVMEEAEQAVNEQLGDGTDRDGHTQDLLTPTEMMSRGWDTADYNSFFADCRDEDFTASECGEMWNAVKDSGGDQTRENPTPQPESGAHLLLVKEEQEASDIAASHLAQPAVEGDLDVATVSSERGQDLLEAVDEVPKVPAHLHQTDDGIEVRPLKDLFREYLVE